MAQAKTLSEVQQVKEHLKPLRRLLDDLDAAIEATVTLRTDQSSLGISIASLRDELAGLESKKAGLVTEIEALTNAKAAADTKLGDLHKKVEAAKDKTKLDIAMMEKEYKEHCAMHNGLVAKLDEQFAQKSKGLSDLLAEQQRKVDAIQKAKEAAKAVVAGL